MATMQSLFIPTKQPTQSAMWIVTFSLSGWRSPAMGMLGLPTKAQIPSQNYGTAMVALPNYLL